MKADAVLATLISIEYVGGFGTFPAARTDGAEFVRSECQERFFSRGVDPPKSSPSRLATPCNDIENDICNKHVRFARQSDTATAEWCNQGGRQGNPDKCNAAYALLGQEYVLCEYNSDTGDCLLSETRRQRSCHESPSVCEILRTASEAADPGDPDVHTIPSSSSFHWQCTQLTDKATCNNRVFKITGTSDPEVEHFATCSWDGSTCSGLGPHVCKLEGDREQQETGYVQTPQLQRGKVCSIFTKDKLCNNGYVYSSGEDWDYIQYSIDDQPPDLVFCEWNYDEGLCQESQLVCPFMCELTAGRNVRAPGTLETDATVSFGDRALEGWCAASVFRWERADICNQYFEVENSPSGYGKQLIACRHIQRNGFSYCGREDRDGFRPCV
mmetsp:Transcript_2954/g.5739  ORF Transcript_2954/g.5739 Transcript_2954/m.5739 type:complete len:385 (-) Transcript_2954:344-1498(-)